MDPAELKRQRTRLQGRIASLDSLPEYGAEGRGIVICAGGARIYTCAYVLVHVLRKSLGCRLPIEIWHFGRAEISECMQGLVEELGVRLVDAEAMLEARPARISDGWQLKAYALLHSRFAEILALDADQVPTRDPAEIFEWQDYRETGALFWPDRVRLSARNPVWEVLGVEGRETASLDSGQMAIDRRRHCRALAVALHLNEEADVLYELVYGDKDTFLAAWMATGEDFALMRHMPLVDPRCLFQRDPAGEILFQHRTGGKWSYAGPQRHIDGFTGAAACEEALALLRRRWNGMVWTAPRRPDGSRAVEARLLENGRYRLIEPGAAERGIALLPFNQIGEGRGDFIQTWYVAPDEGGAEVLSFCDLDGDVVLGLTERPDGIWAGTRCGAAGPAVEMRPAGARPAAPGTRRSDPGILADTRYYVE